MVLSGCANIVPPSGGPRDTTPPKVLSSTPDNYSANFDKRQIRIFFDEFVRFNNLNNELIISPPIKPAPEITLRGKSVLINLPDSLKTETTYHIFFGNAIVDITEGNALENYSFVFSTASYLDSMRLGGSLKDAFNLEAVEEAFVMLYDAEHAYDSIPYIEQPKYITKTDKEGRFDFRYLANTSYKIFALKDINNNLIYDMPDERIAFIDSMITPFDPPQRIFSTPDDSIVDLSNDTFAKDTADVALDVDTIPKYTLVEFDTIDYDMFMFKEIDSTQSILNQSLIAKNAVLFVFRFPLKDYHIQYLNISDSRKYVAEEFNKTKDTLRIWIKDMDLDSLHAVLFHRGEVLDSINISTVPRVGRVAPRQVLHIRSNITSNTAMPYFSKPTIQLTTPARYYDLERIKLLEDSVPVEPLVYFRDTVLKRFLIIDYDYKEHENYLLVIPDSTIYDFYGHANDSLVVDFKTDGKEDYGKLLLNVTMPDTTSQFIIQLMNDKDNMVREKVIRKPGRLYFERLTPGKYNIKAIHDKNFNRRWDTGVYLEGRQAERVYFIDSQIEIRAHWDLETDWHIE